MYVTFLSFFYTGHFSIPGSGGWPPAGSGAAPRGMCHLNPISVGAILFHPQQYIPDLDALCDVVFTYEVLFIS